MSAHRILLAVSTSRYSRHLVDHALDEAERARSDGRTVALHVLNITEQDELERVSRSVGDEGFLGLGPQHEVVRALGAEHDRMARRRVDEVRARAEERGFSVTLTDASGQFAEQVIAHAEQHRCDIILLTRADRPFISRILFGSEADKVARLARRDGLGRVVIDES